MIGKILSNGAKKLVCAPWWVLGFLLLLFNSAVFANGYLFQQVGEAGSMAQQPVSQEHQTPGQEMNDPENDLHCSAKKLVKLKVLKKFTPQPPQPARVVYQPATPLLTIAGFGALPRPAYYLFLFRYTPF